MTLLEQLHQWKPETNLMKEHVTIAENVCNSLWKLFKITIAKKNHKYEMFTFTCNHLSN